MNSSLISCHTVYKKCMDLYLDFSKAVTVTKKGEKDTTVVAVKFKEAREGITNPLDICSVLLRSRVPLLMHK